MVEEKEVYMKRQTLKDSIVVLSAVIVLIFGYFGYVYSAIPAHIRTPAFEHYHIRTQIIVDVKPVDFSEEKFQQPFDKTICSVNISNSPIHFHDNIDQMTHVHWNQMTGGELLKFYGWNYIGGNENNLGRRYDTKFLFGESVNIVGKVLPEVPDNSEFYVYTGDENAYTKRDWNDFLRQDFEEFFGKHSNLDAANNPATSFNLMNWLIPKASAHGDEVDVQSDSTKTTEELTRINNLIGNVVIFVQKDEPTQEQIKTRFNNLIPLSDSTCGG